MLRGQSWQEAAQEAGLQICQATAYRLLSRFRTEGAAGLEDGRHGHRFKLREPVRQWLAEYCRASPTCTSRTVQTALFEHFGIRVSITHLNRLRAALGVSRPALSAGKTSSQRVSHLGRPGRCVLGGCSSLPPRTRRV